MKKLLLILFVLTTLTSYSQLNVNKIFKFATIYAAVNGNTSLSDQNIYSVNTGILEDDVIQTPFDYNFSLGIRKIARFGHENRANTFYDGTESSYGDAANIGKVKGFEFLFEGDIRRQEGINYIDQHHFLRYVANKWLVKIEYLEDGFADVKYFEASQRYRYKIGKKLSLNIGLDQRISEAYGYNPLQDWVLSNGNLHYTYLAIQEGYSFDINTGEYFDPEGELVATSSEVWNAVVIPEVLSNYVDKKKNELAVQWDYAIVAGFDFYHYTKDFWFHSWGSLMPYHYDTGGEYSYHNFNDGLQWIDYSGGLIFGYKINKNLGTFVEGKYNKYWNREWYDFKFGINYIIF